MKNKDLKKFLKTFMHLMEGFKVAKVKNIKIEKPNSFKIKILFRKFDYEQNEYLDKTYKAYYILLIKKSAKGFSISSKLVDKSLKKTQAVKAIVKIEKKLKKFQNKIYKTPNKALIDWVTLLAEFVKFEIKKRKDFLREE